MLCNESLIGHFSLFFIQVMILFVIEEIQLRWNERFHYWDERDTKYGEEYAKLYSTLVECPRLNYLLNDIHEIGYIVYGSRSLGMDWIIARGYTRSRLGELIEDMPRILLYLKNVQNAKAIEAL